MALLHLKQKKLRRQRVGVTFSQDSRQSSSQGAKNAQISRVGRKRTEKCPPAWTISGKAPPIIKSMLGPRGGATSNLAKKGDLAAGREEFSDLATVTNSPPLEGPAGVSDFGNDPHQGSNKKINVNNSTACNQTASSAVPAGPIGAIDSIGNQCDLASRKPPAEIQQNLVERVICTSGEIRADDISSRQSLKISVGKLYYVNDLAREVNGFNAEYKTNGYHGNIRADDNSLTESTNSHSDYAGVTNTDRQSGELVETMIDNRDKNRFRTGLLKPTKGGSHLTPEKAGKLNNSTNACIVNSLEEKNGAKNDNHDRERTHIPKGEIPSPRLTPLNSRVFNTPSRKTNGGDQERPATVAEGFVLPSLPLMSFSKREAFANRGSQTARRARTTTPLCPELAQHLVGKMRYDSAKRRLQRLTPDQKAHVRNFFILFFQNVRPCINGLLYQCCGKGLLTYHP